MTRKAFTLIELLVVIAIIALLLAILIPSLAAIKEYASIVNCLSNQKNIALAYIMYTADNDDRFCSGDVNDNPTAGLATPDWVKAPIVYNAGGGYSRASDAELSTRTRINGLREGAIYPYLEDVKVFHCPGDKRLRFGAARYRTDNPPDPINVYQIYRSYGMPDYYMAENDSDEKILSNIKGGGSKLLFVEDQYDKWYNVDGWSYRPNTMEYWDPLGNYHNKSCTFAFVDGHAEHYKWRDKRSDIFMGDRVAAKNAGYGKNDTQNNPINADHTWLDSHYPGKMRRLGGQ